MQQMLLMKLQDEGCHVDTFLENQEGALVSRDKDSIPYTAQIWFDGRECDTKSEADILKSARILAEIHRKMQLPLEKDYTGRDLKDEYIRHNQELRKIRRFIRKKGASNPFEKDYLQSVEWFLEKGEEAVSMLKTTDYDRLREESLRAGCVCHGEFNQHNVLISGGNIAGEQSNLFQLVTGMQEIKLNNCETEKRWEWERIQVKLFKISIKGLALGQYQQLGSVFFNQTTNILISFTAARAVVSGEMTLGMMMSLTYIVGQLTAPIEQFIGFARSFQDAKISLERLGEIHQREDEEQTLALKVNALPENRALQIEDVSFSYDGADRDYVLEHINLTIPQHKVTAIVGASGSGKTTLIKLLLGFYEPNKGNIKIGDLSLKNMNPHVWRACTGCVMQDGFIFSDSIAKNIAIGAEVIDKERLLHAVTVANIRDFIDSLPLGYNTKIGMEGNGVSQGQRQRILIARAVYKNPEFIFLDEATNALDANNEREIMEHLHQFYKGRTVVVVAHRLSTVRDADNIVVLDKGQVVEEGTHEELTARRGVYYKLVKNQLELGS